MNYQIAALGITEIIITAFLLLLPTLLWVWALYDCARKDFGKRSTKIIWLLIVALFPLIGSIIYMINGRHQGEVVHK